MINRKKKGLNAERELIHLLWEQGFAAHRIAGSGSNKYPSPDIIAGNCLKILAIECKIVKDSKKYIEKKEIEGLKKFSKNFGAESWIAIKFKGEKWFFFSPDLLKETNKNFVLEREYAKQFALTIEEVCKGVEGKY